VFRMRYGNGKGHVWEGSCEGSFLGSYNGDIPSSIVRSVEEMRELKQVHGAEIVLDGAYTGSSQQADGLITRNKRCMLTIRTADCIPVFLISPSQVSLIHAGWRSVKAGILQKGLASFPLEATCAILGPSIYAENYEVDRDLYETWDDPDLKHFLLPRLGTKCDFDLRGFACQILMREGLRADQIHRIPLCTYRDNLPSYRRNGKDAGRLVHYIYREV